MGTVKYGVEQSKGITVKKKRWEIPFQLTNQIGTAFATDKPSNLSSTLFQRNFKTILLLQIRPSKCIDLVWVAKTKAPVYTSYIFCVNVILFEIPSQSD